MGDGAPKEAFVTLATNDTYALGGLVLGTALHRLGTTRDLVIMVTPGVSDSMRNQLATIFDLVYEVTLLDSDDQRNLSLLGRPDLNVTFTKLHCWRLTQYDKAVFLDADTLVLQNIDELFDREELSAAPDAGWPDCFNSGVFVFRPSDETYTRLLDFALTRGSFDGGDQGLLNLFFSDWPTKDIAKHLPFIYNVVSQAFYSYLPAFTEFRSKIKIVHFIGAVKPWHHPYNIHTKTVLVLPDSGHSQEFLQLWWNIFMESVQPVLDPTLPKTPFLQFEHTQPQPRSFPSPVVDTQHAKEEHHQNYSSDQPTTYQVIYPYVPPALDQSFYTPPQPQQYWEPPLPQQPFHPPPEQYWEQPFNPPPEEAPHSFPQEPFIEHRSEARSVEEPREHYQYEPQVVEMPIVSRSYHTYETHYAEEPLTQIDPDSPPPNLYESSYFGVLLSKEAEKVAPAANIEVEKIDVSDDQKTDLVVHVLASNGIVVSHGDVASKNLSNDSTLTGTGFSLDSKRLVTKESLASPEKKEGGLVGELAQMSIGQSRSEFVLLDDRERRLAWERGQADYLGEDRFENIRRKLDQKMAFPSSIQPQRSSSKEDVVPILKSTKQ